MKTLILICWSLLVILTVCNLFDDLWWVLDLLASFSMQIAILLIVCSAILSFYKKYILTVFGIILGLLLLHSVIDKYHYSTEIDIPSNRPLKIVSINLLSSNHNHELAKNYINQSDPDLIVLMEYTPIWDQSLSKAFIEEYPHQIKQVRNHNFGIALWSKHAISSHQILDFTDRDFPMIEAEIEMGEESLTVTSIHLENPVGRDNMALRHHQVDQLINRYRDRNNLVLIGDYNMTPYSSDYTRLRDHLELKETRCSISPTFPIYFMPLRIPIDHCLVSQSISHSCVDLGPNIGSDHFPIEIVLSLHSEHK